MIILLSGTPGSGKTYYAVSLIYNRFVDKKSYDELTKFYKQTKESYLIISNIKNLRIQHLDFDYLYNKYKDEMFTEKFILQLRKLYAVRNIIFVLDEIQNYDFSHHKSNFFHLLTIHRKLLLDFILITQDVSNICSCIVNLSELVIRAVDRTKVINQNVFKYDILVRHSQFKTFRKIKSFYRSKKKEIFELYQSFDIDFDKSSDTQFNEYRNIFRNKLLFYISSVIALIFFAYKLYTHNLTFNNTQDTNQTQITTNQTQNISNQIQNTANETDVFNNQIDMLLNQ